MIAGVGQKVVSSPAVQAGLLASMQNSASIRVLLVEDDEAYREALTEDLSEQGFAIQCFSDGASLLHSLDAAADADVIVVDWSLPKITGIDLLGQLRLQGINIPVVFLTAQARTVHECLAFDGGATDFICRSRGMEVLVRRLKRVVETAKHADRPQSANVMSCGKLILHLDVSRACWNAADPGLTIGEYKIVQLLAQGPGNYVSYRAIYDRLHYEGFIAGNGTEGYRGNVRSAIKRVRNKFKAVDPAFDEIENFTGFGYCWRKAD